MRRYQVLVESDFPTELAGLFKNLETKGNPWGQNASTRADWINEVRKEGVVVPIWGEDVESFDDTEYLFWVGCAGAYDDNAKKTTKAVAEMLYTAGVKYAVLSQAEGCTGDSARRAGNEFLFQMLAEQNIEQLDEVFDGVPPKQRKIVVTCAHCFNTFKNEYPELGGQYEVVHHTQLLNKLVRANRLQPVASGQGRQVTYHDPCFLGRHNKVFEAPRELIGASGANLVEMPRNKNTGFCCGAGGARMWMEETIGQRINVNRTEEAVGTGAEAIAIGCPFCKTMMNDGVNNVIEDDEKKPEVLDIAQMLRDSVKVDGELPQAREPEWIEQPERGWVDPKKAEEEERQRLEEEEAKRKKAEAAEKKKAEKASAAGAGAAAAGAAAGAAAKGGAPTPGGAPKPGGAKGGAPTPGGAKKGAPAPGGAPKPGGAKAGAPTPGGAKKGAPAPGGAPKPGGAKAGAPVPGGAKGGAPTPGGAKKGAPAPGGAPKPGGAKGGAPVPGGAKKGAPVPGGAKAAKPAAQAEPAAAETEAPTEAPKATKGAPIPGGARKGAPVPGGAKKAAPAAKPKAEKTAPAEEAAAEVAATESEQPAAEQPKTASGAPVPGGARKGAPIPGGARKAKPVASTPAPAAEETEAQEAPAQPEAEQAPAQPEVTEQQSAEDATSTEQATETPAEETQAPSASAKNLPRNQHGVPLPGSARRK